MKKAKSVFFYLLLISILNNINYIFSEDVEKPEWFQKLEELKENSSTDYTTWIKMFNILPGPVKENIRKKLYQPVSGLKLKQSPPLKPIKISVLKIIKAAIPDPIWLLLSLTSHNPITLKESEHSFVSLAMSVANTTIPNQTLKYLLKKSWITLLQDIPLSDNYEHKAIRLMFNKLGIIVNSWLFTGYYTVECIKATTLSE